jgi:hypothetical protein
MIEKTSFHFVYVVNEEGMSSIFEDFKQKLVFPHHATLIYFSSNDSFIFSKELDILQKRYPTQFILYKMSEELVDASTSVQELLEAVINSNTKDKLLFILWHNDELIHVVSNRLWFLGVCKNQIKIC